MYKHKFHILLGMFSLIISIVLPTVIYQYYFLLKTWNEIILQSNASILIAYGLLSIMILLLALFLLIAFHELGGYLNGLIKNDKQAVERFAGTQH